MPNFRLSASEAAELAMYLFKGSVEKPTPAGQHDVTRGQTLVQTSGCLNCHASKIENKYSAPRLSTLNWDRGCLAEHNSASKAPDFGFQPDERAALQALGQADRS